MDGPNDGKAVVCLRAKQISHFVKVSGSSNCLLACAHFCCRQRKRKRIRELGLKLTCARCVRAHSDFCALFQNFPMPANVSIKGHSAMSEFNTTYNPKARGALGAEFIYNSTGYLFTKSENLLVQLGWPPKLPVNEPNSFA